MKDVENVGIMQGFMDSFPMDDDEEGDEGYSSEELIGRKPDSPEILMNNLRGDYRSIDARREELADLVGYNAAEQTPDEVLAMLQPVLAGGGIGGLPQSQPMAQGPQAPMMPPPGPPPMGGPMPGPPPGAPPMPPGPPMPQGPAPAGGIGALPQGPQAPMGMAMGGLVQRFSNGTGPAGAVPTGNESADDDADDDAASGTAAAAAGLGISSRSFTPAQRKAALDSVFKSLEPAKADTRTMETRVADATRLYQGLLGQDKNLTQAQMLFDIAGAGLALAGNVDPRTGQPLRGSFVSRLAGAASQLPAQIGARASEADKINQQIKLLGLQAAEKERESERAAALKREALKVSIGREILKGDTAEAVAAGKEARRAAEAAEKAKNAGLTPARQQSLLANMDLVNAYASGAPLADPNIAALELSLKNYTQPRTEYYTDPQSDRILPRTVRNELPDYLTQAINARAKALGSRPTAPGQASGQAPAPTMSTAPGAPAPVSAPVPAQGAAPQIGQAVPTNLYRLASTGTGPIALFNSGVSRIPLIGGKVPPEYEQSVTEIENSVAQLVKSLQQTTRMANAERVDIEQRLSVLPRFIDRPDAFQNRLIALDNVLATIETETLSKAQQENIGAPGRQEAEKKLSEVQHMRKMIGLPIRVYTRQQAMSLPPGTEFYFVPQNRFKRRDPE